MDVLGDVAGQPRLSLGQLGLDGAARDALLRPAPTQDAVREAERRLALSMAQEATRRDTELGLGPAGPVVGAFERATREVPTTPYDGRATFRLSFDGQGRVLGVEVLSASSHFAVWEQVGRMGAAALAARAAKLPDGARGLELDVEVVSSVQLPSGADPGFDVTLGGLTLKKAGKKRRSGKPRNAGVDLLKPVLELEDVELKDPTGRVIGKMPALKAGVTVFGLRGDPSDIGAHPRRVVHARVLGERAL